MASENHLGVVSTAEKILAKNPDDIIVQRCRQIALIKEDKTAECAKLFKQPPPTSEVESCYVYAYLL